MAVHDDKYVVRSFRKRRYSTYTFCARKRVMRTSSVDSCTHKSAENVYVKMDSQSNQGLNNNLTKRFYQRIRNITLTNGAVQFLSVFKL